VGKIIELVAEDGFRLSAYRADPAGAPRGGLVVVQEIFGVNRHIRGVCDGYAADGYLAVAPALFDRVQPGVELGYAPKDIEAGRAIRAGCDLDHAIADVAAARDVAGAAGRVGIVGYCWGGFVVWRAASRARGFSAAITYYGGGMTDALDEKLLCPVMSHFGESDHAIPIEGARKLAAAYPGVVVHTYDAGHGFNCEERGSYDAEAARLARSRTIEFLRRNVG